MLTAVRVTSHFPAASGRVGGRPRYEDMPACRQDGCWEVANISLRNSLLLFCGANTAGIFMLRACSSLSQSPRLPSGLPSRQEVEIFSAIRMREKYYLLLDCLGRLCLAGYNHSGDGRAASMILFRSRPARRRGYGSASQTCSAQVGRGIGVSQAAVLRT